MNHPLPDEGQVEARVRAAAELLVDPGTATILDEIDLGDGEIAHATIRLYEAAVARLNAETPPREGLFRAEARASGPLNQDGPQRMRLALVRDLPERTRR